jgi:zinc/manganese transport system substrate-binding protein
MRPVARVRPRAVFGYDPVMKTVSGLCLGVMVALAAAGCGASPADPTKGARVVHVVAAENVWGDVVAQIGGRHASVSSILSDPGADPHLFSSNPRDAARLATANLVIVNGLGYDDFARKLLGASSGSKRRVLTMADVMDTGDSNPHLWYDAPRLPSAADAIADALAAEDPRDARLFRGNAARFGESLAPLLRTIASIEQRHAGAPVAYTERVAGYLLDAAGLTVRTPAGFARAVESGSEPGPGDTQRMDDLLSRREVDALIYNAQAITPVTKRLRSLAQRSGVPVVAVTETLPPGQRFQDWQLRQARALLAALGEA